MMYDRMMTIGWTDVWMPISAVLHGHLPSSPGHGNISWAEKTTQKFSMVMINVDYNYLKTFGLKMVKGRSVKKTKKSENCSTDI